jgi:hypothetical protein
VEQVGRRWGLRRRARRTLPFAKKGRKTFSRAFGATIPRMEPDWWGIGPSTLAQWVGAAVTFAAVIVALFKDSIHGMLYGAEFRVTCTKDTPWTVKTRTIGWPGPGASVPRWKGDSYFVRVKVDNTGGTRADKAEVSLTEFAVRGLDSNFTELPMMLPLNMKWSNRPEAILDGISSQMSAFCDLISICDPSNPYQKRPAGLPAGETVAHLETEIEPLDDSHALAPGTYRLKIRIAAANVAPIDRLVEFTHDGRWTPDDGAMRRDHLAVSLTPTGIAGAFLKAGKKLAKPFQRR